MVADANFNLQTVLDGLGQGILIFDSNGLLVQENLAVRTLLGNDLNIIRDGGWDAASTLFNAQQTNPDYYIDAVCKNAIELREPVRFNIFRSGEYVPCWASAIHNPDGKSFMMITIDVPDWEALTNILDIFHSEITESIRSTHGHIDLIRQDMAHQDPGASVEHLSKRITGFTKLIGIHMHRNGRFLAMLERMEDIRLGRLREKIEARYRKIDLENYLEDFVEELDEIMLVDPETPAHDHRSRLEIDIKKKIAIRASTLYLTRILHDIFSNAIMYSMVATPIKVAVHVKGKNAQIDIIDEGYGIREGERDRVFIAFRRARQPQIIAEFGYGLSLYLGKHEVEAMDGRMWFDSEEGVGTTFHLMLPLWDASPSSSSQILSP